MAVLCLLSAWLWPLASLSRAHAHAHAHAGLFNAELRRSCRGRTLLRPGTGRVSGAKQLYIFGHANQSCCALFLLPVSTSPPLCLLLVQAPLAAVLASDDALVQPEEGPGLSVPAASDGPRGRCGEAVEARASEDGDEAVAGAVQMAVAVHADWSVIGPTKEVRAVRVEGATPGQRSRNVIATEQWGHADTAHYCRGVSRRAAGAVCCLSITASARVRAGGAGRDRRPTSPPAFRPALLRFANPFPRNPCARPGCMDTGTKGTGDGAAGVSCVVEEFAIVGRRARIHCDPRLPACHVLTQTLFDG